MDQAMLVLMPDAQFEDDGEIEREVLGNLADVAVHHELVAERIAGEDWARADALIVYYGVPIDRSLVERLDSCRILVRAGVGYDHIDIAACAARGIPVCNVPDYGTTEVADHAIALTLALARGLVSYHARLLADPHAGWHWSGAPLVRRLRGGTFGIVGLGRIGTAASRRARALDMEVCFYDPYLPDGAELAHGYRRYDSLEALLAASDVVSLHCPLTARQPQHDRRGGAARDQAGRVADQHRARRPGGSQRARGGPARRPAGRRRPSTCCRTSRRTPNTR